MVHRPLPTTDCPQQPKLPDQALASTAAFAAWLNGLEGRTWIATGRAAGWDCYTKLKAIGAANNAP